MNKHWRRHVRGIRSRVQKLVQYGYKTDPACWVACQDLELALEKLERALTDVEHKAGPHHVLIRRSPA